MKPSLSRRGFVAAAPAVLSSLHAQADRIRIGIIGAGWRGQSLMKDIEACRDLNVAVTAVCDIYRPNREKAADAAHKAWGAAPRTTVSYEELLGWRDVDAVIIATPDFGHSRILKAAVEAGKDAYCEKPMGTDFAEAKAAWQAVRQSGRVVQIGTQRRSDGKYIAMANLVRAGKLGKVTRVETCVNFQEPRWRRDHSEIRAENVAWDQFLLHAPKRDFDARRLREWQLFSDYTNGIPGLWMSHFIDLVPWFLGDPFPAGAVANGGVFLWKDGRQTSDVFCALLDYPTGVLVTFAMSLTNSAGNRNHWYGTLGTLDMDSFTMDGSGSSMKDRIAGKVSVQPEEVNSHMANFIECLRSRQRPRADIDAGFQHAVAGCMAARALEEGRRIRFDPQRIELI